MPGDAEPPKPAPVPESPLTPAASRSAAATISTIQTPVSEGSTDGGATSPFSAHQLAPDPFTHLAGAISSTKQRPFPSAADAGPRDPISLAEDLVTSTAAAAAHATDSYMAQYYVEAERRALGVVEAYADPYVESAASNAEMLKQAATPYLESVAQVCARPAYAHPASAPLSCVSARHSAV